MKVNFSFEAYNLELLEFALNNERISEVIIGSIELSRFFTFEMSELPSIIKKLREKSKLVYIQADRLVNQSSFSSYIENVEEVSRFDIDALRCLDLGVAQYCWTNIKHLSLHLISEGRNHNLHALQTHVDFLTPSLKRVVISNEIPKKVLAQVSKKLSVDIEVYVAGPLLLFHSPRALLNQVSKKSIISCTASSQESPHKGFDLLQNSAGTFMSHFRDISLLDRIDELTDLGISFFRLNLSSLSSAQLKNFDFKKYPRSFIRGFFDLNKSDAIFVKLKNSHIRRVDGPYLGEVIDVEKKKGIVISLKSQGSEIHEGMKVVAKTPTGKTKVFVIKNLKSLDGHLIEKAESGQNVIVHSPGGVMVKTVIEKFISLEE